MIDLEQLKKYRWPFALLVLGVLISAGLYFWFPSLILFYTFISVCIVIIFLWLGNSLITKGLNYLLPWRAYGRKRFFLHLFLGVVYSVGVINLSYVVVKAFFTDFLPTTEQMIVANVYGAIVIIPVFSIYFSLHFLSHWQESAMEMERFQRESITSQLNTLKNHLDPHFLFNNLNILSALIDKSKDQSQEFLGRFAQVYRTMLLTKAEDLVTVEEEVEFIQTYIYLIQTRFEEHIQFDIQLGESDRVYMLPPLTLQMLIENAVKHNNIVPGFPLEISIFREGSWLTVTNTIREKPEDIRTKSGTGLANIRARYKYYTDEELEIKREGDLFVARLPLIEMEIL